MIFVFVSMIVAFSVAGLSSSERKDTGFMVKCYQVTKDDKCFDELKRGSNVIK